LGSFVANDLVGVAKRKMRRSRSATSCERYQQESLARHPITISFHPGPRERWLHIRILHRHICFISESQSFVVFGIMCLDHLGKTPYNKSGSAEPFSSNRKNYRSTLECFDKQSVIRLRFSACQSGKWHRKTAANRSVCPRGHWGTPYARDQPQSDAHQISLLGNSSLRRRPEWQTS